MSIGWKESWWGEPWPGRTCHDATGRLLEEMHTSVPVGENCVLCLTPIKPDQSGCAAPCEAPDGPRIVNAHHECIFRSIFGSPGHLDGRCSCTGATPAGWEPWHRNPQRWCETGDVPESAHTYREEALIVWARDAATPFVSRRICTGRPACLICGERCECS
jgi:hypothetical protein